MNNALSLSCLSPDSCLYPDIPKVDPECTPPIKAFVVEMNLIEALYPRLFMDGSEEREGVVNSLDGCRSKSPRVKTTFPRAYSLVKTEVSRRRSEATYLDEDTRFLFGALDVVTYPLFFALVYDVNINSPKGSELLWKINSNLLLSFYPALMKVQGALTIFHFNERPIDDAPTHNFLFFGDERPDRIRCTIEELKSSSPKPIFVHEGQPYLDDRYLLEKRRPQDGEPFNLVEFAKLFRKK